MYGWISSLEPVDRDFVLALFVVVRVCCVEGARMEGSGMAVVKWRMMLR